MSTLHCLNKISPVGLKLLPDTFTQVDDMATAEAVLVRSAVMHEMELPSSLLSIARAGSGVNNIPLDKCADQGVVVFNTPGANANGVKELVFAGAFLAARDVVGGVNWLREQDPADEVAKKVEKKKSAFGGGEILGKTMGVIGLGAIGIKVANTAKALGMNVVVYNRTWNDAKKAQLADGIIYADLDTLYAQANYVSLHAALTDGTKGMINADAMSKMQDGTVVLNFSRDKLVNDADMAAALESGKIARYVTDFPNEAVMGMKNVIAIPHLGASTEESEDNCAMMAVNQTADYIANGNILNSVNYPDLSCARAGEVRVTVMSKCGCDFAKLATEAGATVVASCSATRGAYSYSIVDCASAPADLASKLEALEGVVRVRVL